MISFSFATPRRGKEYRNLMSENQPSKRPLAERLQDSELILRAVSRGVREALIRHKQAGNPIAAWRDGEVVWIQPEDIEIPPEP
jgi:hypothetical protein